MPAVVGAMRNRGDGPKAWSDARTRLMLARARLVEMETKEKQGLLIPADQLGECWLAAYSALRMTLLVVPARLGSQVGMCRDATEIAGLARRLLNEAMDSYARMPVLIGSEEVTAEEAEEIDDEPSAGPSH